MPAASSAVAWTKTSFEPSSGVMKPKPLAPLKNLTVPEVLMMRSFPFVHDANRSGMRFRAAQATQVWEEARAR